jgi:PASTA domain-containing protein
MRRLPVVFVLVFAGCAPSQNGTDLGTVANPPPSLSSQHTTAPPPTSPSPTVAKVKIPRLVGLSLAKAKRLLEALGFEVTIKRKVSTNHKPGTVLAQSLRVGRRVEFGKRVTLTVAKAKPNPPPPPPSDCDPSYLDVCLHDGIGDYDCAGGSGNGPNYVSGPIRVVGSDPFGLDADNDGWGCE